MPKPLQPTKAIQLLVEGNDQRNFFDAFVEHLDIAKQLQIQDFGGVGELNGFLGVMVKQSGFHDTVKMLGIVRDAEASAESAALTREQVRALVDAHGPVMARNW